MLFDISHVMETTATDADKKVNTAESYVVREIPNMISWRNCFGYELSSATQLTASVFDSDRETLESNTITPFQITS